MASIQQYQTKKGRKWMYKVDMGIDPITQKRKMTTKRGFNTKKEAQIAAANLEKELREKTFIEVTEQNVKSLIDEWIENKAKYDMRPSTLANRKGIIKNRIIPSLGHIKVKDIEPSVIQSFYNKLINDDKLSTAYVRTIHNLLSGVFGYAKHWDKIKVNPMDKISAPIPKSKNMTTWSRDEIDKFMDVARDYPTYIAYALAIYTGMRMGEILGLRWSDIDFNNNTIHITQAMVRIDGGFDFDEPKTENSKRQIYIDDDLVNDLKEHKENQKYPSDLVVTTKIGTPYSPRNLQRNFNMIIDKSKVTKIRFHDLRHTHATMLLKLGENPKVVSERLGHARTSITLDLYSHVLPDMQKQAAKNISSYLRGQNVVKDDK